MDPLTILAILAEAAKLANTISERLAKGEITPEEALAQWQETTVRWRDAAFAWRNTETPDA